MAYRERTTAVPGVVLWTQDAGSSPAPRRILPDGCMDLIWDGTQLLIAGPDSTSRWHLPVSNARYVGLRFSEGGGPAAIGTTADAVRDQSPPVEAVWSSRAASELGERAADAPEEALERWLESRSTPCDPTGFGRAVFRLAASGTPARVIAERLGVGARQLHRRCLPLFGYGPQHLGRVLRLQRAVATARAGVPLAMVAATTGFADQAHLSRDVRDLAGTTPTSLLSELYG